MANGISLNDPNEGTADVRVYRVGNDIVLKAGDGGEGNVIPFSDNNMNFGSATKRWDTLYGESTSALYADVAEKYLVAGEVAPGDVIVISQNPASNYEAEKSNQLADKKVLGVVSTNPAVRMNDGLENGTYIALCGRVPCRVEGPVQKGDLLVTGYDGVAICEDREEFDRIAIHPKAYFAKALETNLSPEVKMVEVLVL